ncbi:DNA repair protein RecO [Candidatus Peregrinibacteria bacterium]|nr:DNA repair protein RecO [Candidatus Peregrinibacteria bacterium]
MKNLKIQGIIINKRAVGEHDYSVTIFTPFYGKIQAGARGAKQISSKFTGHLDLLNICDFQLYQSPKSYTITECSLKSSFPSFRENLGKFYYASETAKIIKAFETENENCEDMYSLLIQTFDAFDKYNCENLVFEAFKIKLFNLTGIMPDIYCIEETEFGNDDLRFKKLLKFILTNNYKDILRLSLNENDKITLENLTRSLNEYCPI